METNKKIMNSNMIRIYKQPGNKRILNTAQQMLFGRLLWMKAAKTIKIKYKRQS